MKKTIKNKPISFKQYQKLNGKYPLADLILNTAVRIAESKRLVDEWNGKDNFVDIQTKKSGSNKNRVFLNIKAKEALRKLEPMKGLSVKTFQRLINSISEEVGFKFTAHNLRSTCMSQLIENGVDLVSVQTIANHASIEQTAQYIKLSEGTMLAAVSTLDANKTIMGMTPFEMKSEIIKLRKQLERLEKNNDTK